jgi:hypothetical protein
MRTGNKLRALLPGLPAKSPEFRNIFRARGRCAKVFSVRVNCARVRVVARLPCGEGVPTNGGCCMERRGRVGEFCASDGVQEIVLE